MPASEEYNPGFKSQSDNEQPIAQQPKRQPKPDWFKVPVNSGAENEAVIRLIRSLKLNTVCEEANCPNAGECFSRKTATFMLLGSQCTRHCTFCAVGKGSPEEPDTGEPQHLAQAIEQLALKYVVLTMVTRDDLPDGGAAHFVRVIDAIREHNKASTPAIEVLISDLQGNNEALNLFVAVKPDVINHNIETVPRLYPTVRPEANYQRSLDLLRTVKANNPAILTKSGIMVGLGEQESEVVAVLQDLRGAGCDLLTIGQYLSPSRNHHPVVEYIHPDQFAKYKQLALEMGFRHVASGPLVRSSYHASDAIKGI